MTRLVLVALLAVVLSARAAADLYVEPYLQRPTPDGVTVMWWTEGSEPASRIEYGPGFSTVVAASNELFSVPGAESRYLHTARISGLAPGSAHAYRVRSGSDLSDGYTFRTAPPPGSGFHFVVTGDGRTDNDAVIARHRAVTELARQQDPGIAFCGGDMVYSGNDTHWSRFWRRVATATDGGSSLASTVPYHLVAGNHEIWDTVTGYVGGNLDTTMARFQAYCDNPDNGSADPHWRERYYSIRYGCATFIILDSNNTTDDAHDNNTRMTDGTTPDWEPGSEQHNWMAAELAQAQQDSAFTFVLGHPSPYCRGVHGDPADSQSGWQLRVLDPLFRQYGVDAVITSHDHLVEHGLTGPAGFQAAMDLDDPANLNYLVQGNSGEGARGAETGWETWMDIEGNDAAPFYTAYFYDWAGTARVSFLDVDIESLGGGEYQATFRTLRDDGQAFDTFTLTRHLGPARVPEPAGPLAALMIILLARRPRARRR